MHADLAVFRHLYGASGLWLWAMAALTIVGSGWALIPIAALTAFERTREHALRLIALLVGVAVTVFSIKMLVGRARPCGSLAHVHALVFSAPHDPSFPSGHAAGAFAVAAFVAFEARVHPFAKIALFVIAAGIAISRVVLGVHFPSDIVAGAILGTLSSAVYFATRRSFARKERNEARTAGIL
ncbi:MAG TPA: phosphatase PAP2 family protein [Polyangiaceae bacterium]|jgi:undecaprenyl-diphosphatase